MKTRYFIPVLLIGMILGAMWGCGSSSSAATTDPTVAALQAAVATLQSDVKTLQSQVAALQAQPSGSGSTPAVYIVAPNDKAANAVARDAYQALMRRRTTEAVATTTATTQAVTPCTGIGTLTGRPFNSDALGSNKLSGKSCTGYLFNISTALTGEYGYIQPLLTGQLLFTGMNCSGDMYVSPYWYKNGVPTFTEEGVNDGAVFTFDPNNLGPNDTSTYYMVQAGETATTGLTMASLWDTAANSCQSTTIDSIATFLVQPNNSTTTGIGSAPVAGPVTVGP